METETDRKKLKKKLEREARELDRLFNHNLNDMRAWQMLEPYAGKPASEVPHGIMTVAVLAGYYSVDEWMGSLMKRMKKNFRRTMELQQRKNRDSGIRSAKTDR